MERTRVVLVAFGALFIVAGVAYGQAQDSETYLPWLWMPLFVLAGVSCWVFAWHLRSAFWWQTSRILVVLAILARIYGIVGNVHYGANGWKATAGICLYLVGAGALHRVWTIDFRYWSRRVAATGGR